MTAINSKPNSNQVIFVQSTTEPVEKLHLRKSLWALVAVFIVCVIGGFLLGTLFASKLKHLNDANADNDKTDVTDTPVLNCSGHQLEFIPRFDWSAQPEQSPLEKLRNPVSKAIIAHTVTPNCETEASCKKQVRAIQTLHIEKRGWDDIGYNFLIGGDGRVYIGRGWDNVGAHTRGHNHGSICIAFIGTYEVIEPSHQQLCSAKELLERGRALGKLSNAYELYGHRQLTTTSSPGTALYKIIQTWDHWRKTATI